MTEQIYDENFNIYKAFTTAEERLYLSYSSSDSDGKSLRKSIFINQLKKIFINLNEESDITNNMQYIATKNTTFDRLLFNLRKFFDGEEIDSIWFKLYDIYSKDI